MYIAGLDKLDNKILSALENNARATYSEIGELVGLSRVAVKNRMEVMEKNGIIQGYKTVVNPTKVPGGVRFFVDVEAVPELYKEVVDALGQDCFLRQVYTTTGECRLHAIGFAPNITTMEAHVKLLFNQTKGIRKMSYHLLLSTIKDVDGGIAYEREVSGSVSGD